jgi:hypothetical protein
MPEGYSQAVAGPRPKIPSAVPLAQADDERKKIYAPLANWQDEKPPAAEPPGPPESGPPPEPGDPAGLARPMISLEDRKAFLAALLGGKRYSKRYSLYGSYEICLEDRTTDETEVMYGQLALDESQGLLKNDEEWAVRLERYQLALQLRAIHGLKGGEGYPPLELNAGPGKVFSERLATLMLLPKPMYQGLMAALRSFETEVAELTNKALDESFWKAGVGASASTPTAPAR